MRPVVVVVLVSLWESALALVRVPLPGRRRGAIKMNHAPSHLDTSSKLVPWDFSKYGGRFKLEEAADGKRFFERWGFVVFTEVMSEEENGAVLEGLVDDLHEINPSTRHIKSAMEFDEADLPTSPNRSFRTTCNIVFGRFATAIRTSTGVREAFATLHETPAEQLGCSWDTLFYTSQASEVTGAMATQLHWDHNGYCGGKRYPLSDSLCLQAVYYASETDLTTPAFACCPGSHRLWQAYSESELNPAKQGDKLLNYMPLTAFDEDFIDRSGLMPPVRIHTPPASILIWDARTCHGNTPAAVRTSAPSIGRVSLAVCYHPVAQRSLAVQKDALVKALGCVRTTHHPAVMLSHNKQGYPADWTAEAEAEPNERVRDLHISLNPSVSEDEFQEMIQRAAMNETTKRHLTQTLSIHRGNVQTLLYDSYWGRNGLSEEDCYGPFSSLQMQDLRRLVDPRFSFVQGVHPAESESCKGGNRVCP